MFQVPYKILCKVVNVELKVNNPRRPATPPPSLCSSSPDPPSRFWRELVVVVIKLSLVLFLFAAAQAEAETDEVYAQITLQPESDVSVHRHPKFFLFANSFSLSCYHYLVWKCPEFRFLNPQCRNSAFSVLLFLSVLSTRIQRVYPSRGFVS